MMMSEHGTEKVNGPGKDPNPGVVTTNMTNRVQRGIGDGGAILDHPLSPQLSINIVLARRLVAPIYSRR